jgi:Ion channel
VRPLLHERDGTSIKLRFYCGSRDSTELERRRPQLWLIAVMVTTVGGLLVAHVVEVVAWSLIYAILGVAPPESNVLYFAFVNYTTLGYGDIVPVERWRLLGPMTAMNGVLLFGWSTAVIFEVLRHSMRIHGRKDER